MNIRIIVALAASLLLLASCGGSSSSGTSGAFFNSGDITDIEPSLQSSEEIIALVRNAPTLSYKTIDANIKLSVGYGGIKQGVDENGKRVFLMGSHKKNYEAHNMFFCHESDLSCTRLVDNSGEQHLGSIGEFYDGKIWINTADKTVDTAGGIFGSTLNYYDVNTRAYHKRVLPLTGLNGETRTMSLGSDKKLYLGGTNFSSVPHYASVAYVNPKDLSDYRLYTNYFTEAAVDRARSVAADDDYIYQVVGDSPLYLLAINKTTGTGSKLNESTDGKVIQLADGVSFEYTKDGIKTYHYLYNGILSEGSDNISNISVPWYDPLTTPPNHQGGYWAQKGNYYLEYNTTGYEKASYSVQNMPTTVQNASGTNSFDFTATTEGRDISFAISNIDVYSQDVTRVTTLSDGNILIRGVAYSGISLLNTTTDIASYLGAVGFSPSVMEEFYDYSKNKTQVMFEGYPSVNASIYDPSDYISSANIDPLGYLRSTKDINCIVDCLTKDIDMHRALEMEQIDETVYFAAMQYRSGVSGGLIWYNTLTKEKKAISEGLFNNYQTRSLIKMNNKLVIGTQAVDNTEYGGSARPATPKIFVFDPITEKIIKEYTPLAGLNAVDTGRIESIDGRHIIGITNDQAYNGNTQASKTFVYIIDTYTDEIVMKKTIDMMNNMIVTPEGSSRNRNYAFVKHDGFIYTYISSRTLIKIDLNGEITPISLLPVQGELTFVGNTAYFAIGTNILKMGI